MADDSKLDVDLDVFEQPEQANFPRRPNIISRRGHAVRLIVTINQVADLGTKFVTISASVFALGPEHLGQASHVSRSRKLWADEQKGFDIDAADLPSRHEIVVERDPDDHLGQGPYEAVVTVSPSSARPDDLSTVTGGDEFSIEFVSM